MSWLEDRARRNARSRIYFAQPVNGGPIKIGMSGDVETRRQQLASWAPWGIEILCAFPGGQMRESALKWALRHYQIQGEWLRSCTSVWRVIAHVEAHGDLEWLPREGDVPSADAFARELIEFYGSRAEAAKALGVSVTTVPSPTQGVVQVQGHTCAYGRYVIERARIRGDLPDYLHRPSFPANADTQAQGAAA